MGGDVYPKILKARLPDNYPKTLKIYPKKKLENVNIIVITPKSCLNLNMICKMKGPLWGHVACAICRENYFNTGI